MSKKPTVVDRDLRPDGIRHLMVEDFEWCDVTGRPVKKDRWEMAFRRVESKTDNKNQLWDIEDIVMDIRVLKYGEIAREICSPTPKPFRIKNRPITEKDLWDEKYTGELEDYIFKSNDEIGRKDRWEMGVRDIAHIIGIKTAYFSIDEFNSAVDEFFKKIKLINKRT